MSPLTYGAIAAIVVCWAWITVDLWLKWRERADHQEPHLSYIIVGIVGGIVLTAMIWLIWLVLSAD